MSTAIQSDLRPSATNPKSVMKVSAEPGQYLTFMLAGDVFAIGILGIKEIIEYSNLTVVPMMPPYIRGVINLRGAVVPVMDLLVRFGAEPSQVTKRTGIIIMEAEAGSGHQVIGVVVDAVNAVLDIASSDIEPPPAFGAKIRTDFMQGLGKVNGRFVILLNVNHMLSIDEVAAFTEADTAALAAGVEAAST